MEQLELRVLKQMENYVSPFDYGTEGFNDRWWHGPRIDTIADAEDCDTAYVQLLKDGIEIGRAEITYRDISLIMLVLPLPYVVERSGFLR